MAKEKKEKPHYLNALDTPQMMAEMVFDGKQTAYAVYSKTDGSISREEMLNDYWEPYPPYHGYIASMNFPSAPEEYGSDADLLNSIREFIRKWVDLSPIYEKVCAYYVLLTWVYDRFDDIPYLRILADLGSGKSRLGIDVLGKICFRSVRTSAAASTAAIFRILHDLRGTLVLDEADLGDHSDKTSDFIQILNSGYKRDIPVLRCSGVGTSMSVNSFHVFGPKIIIGREQMKDAALESRCLLVRLTATSRTDIPFSVNRTLDEDAQVLRNKLLYWRFANHTKSPDDYNLDFVNMDISPRLKQLFLILSAIVTDPEAVRELKEYAHELNREAITLRTETWEGEVAEAIAWAIATKGKSEDIGDDLFVSYELLTERINNTRGEDARKITVKGVSKAIRQGMSLTAGKSKDKSKRGLKAPEHIIMKTLNSFGYAPSKDTELPDQSAEADAPNTPDF